MTDARIRMQIRERFAQIVRSPGTERVFPSNIEWHLADAEDLPLADGTVDVVITNGVLNLCPDKPKVLAELHRVLRPGGRLQMADVMLHEDVTAEDVAKLGTWSD